MKKFKNSITYKDTNGDNKRVNFKTREKLLQHLNKNTKLHELNNVRIHFGPISLPIKDTVWNGK